MKFSETWLREWVKTACHREQLLDALTLAGLEVDGIEPVCGASGPFVIGRVMQVMPHPSADRLRVCQVDVGDAQPLTIVCGASNVLEGAKVIVAQAGAVTASGVTIQPNTIRGVDSNGMLVSEEELGLVEHSDGLWLLPETAEVGTEFLSWLDLAEDVSIEVDLTPNRGDCLSIFGIAREVAAMMDAPLQAINPASWLVSHDEQVPVRVADSSACPVYRGCLIKGVNARRETPLWMRERLRRSGLRPVQALVDITNYVLLELGQPLHAFDANKLSGEVHVRFARPGETMVLLDQKDITLAADNLIIADDSGPIALAGIMGGLHTAIDEDTTDVFLECAHFSPASMIGRARQHGLHTDASHRFERGVDPGLPARALQRTVELIQAIVGGQAGPETTVLDERNTAARASIMLTAASLKSVLDVTIPAELVEKKLRALGCRVDPLEAQWRVTPPSHRFDLAIEEDLIEEVARLYGYDKLPAVLPIAPVSPVLSSERTLSTTRLQQIMAASGFQEVITYSFVSEELQSLVDPERVPLRLRNPISSEMSVMRTSMWPGLLRAAAYNQNRRHTSIRLFEIGQVFRGQLEEGALHQDVWVGGLWTGEAQPEQWDLPRRAVDFYDLKGKIESILLACGHTVDGQMSFRFVPEVHPALHPGQSARVCALNGTSVGWAGRLHPVVEKKLGFDGAVFVFELPLEWIESINLPQFKAVSRLPSVRRDIAVVVSEAVSVGSVQAIIRAECGALIKDVRVFDVFRGASVPEGKKSLALGVTLQSAERTLTESDVSGCFEQVIQRLRKDLGAQLRE